MTTTATTATTNDPSPSAYYKCWIAYEALQEAALATSYKSVFVALRCDCCHVPQCWKAQRVVPLPPKLRHRIRWYDHCSSVASSSTTTTTGLTAEECHAIREHFVSHHQRIELILHALKPSLDRIYELFPPHLDHHNAVKEMSQDVADRLVQECTYVANGWLAVSQLVRGVSQLDRIQYLQYVRTLGGVSGGNSPHMMTLSAKTAGLESLLASLSDDELAQVIRDRTPAGRAAEGFVDCLDALSRCWMDHVVTATTTIGITTGTKGTPNSELSTRVLRRLYGSRLLQALGSLRSPISGIGAEMRQLYDYQNYGLSDHYLDLFEDDGPEFGTHSVGIPPKQYDVARAEFAHLRRQWKTKIWEHFYTNTRPAFCQELSGLLGLKKDTATVGFGLGSSVTEVLGRLVASLSIYASDFQVVLADDEFVTLQRAAAILGRNGAHVCRVPADELSAHVLQVPLLEEKKDETSIRQVVFVSLVNSCTQQIAPIDWILQAPTDTVVVVDITQAIMNIPLYLDAFATRPNVFLVGSCIKHARCGEGLAFLTYSRAKERLINEPASGWTAFLSGLRENKTVDAQSNHLLYDDGLEWDGGTPSWVESAFVATRVIQSLPPVEMQHKYVQEIKQSFLALVQDRLSSEQLASDSKSNTLALPVSSTAVDLPYGLDYKVVNGTTFLRIGFGIHNLRYHLDALTQAVAEYL